MILGKHKHYCSFRKRSSGADEARRVFGYSGLIIQLRSRYG